MTNFELLNKAIDKSELGMTGLSRKSGIKRETLYNRLKGIGEFTASEIVALSEALGLKKSEREKIFFTH